MSSKIQTLASRNFWTVPINFMFVFDDTTSFQSCKISLAEALKIVVVLVLFPQMENIRFSMKVDSQQVFPSVPSIPISH